MRFSFTLFWGIDCHSLYMVFIMMSITKNSPGMKTLLLGNEAITRGALEAGVDVVDTALAPFGLVVDLP